MRRNIKLSAILILFVCTVFTSVVYASNVLNIQVIPNRMNILINGGKVDIDNFLYNNTTYVPLRKIAELLDKELTWDDKTKTIDITDKETKVGGFYTKCDGIEAILIADVNDHILDLEFHLRNTTDEDLLMSII